jgi:hypothetical protein
MRVLPSSKVLSLPYSTKFRRCYREARYSKSDETAESLRRIVEPATALPSKSLRHAMTCARVTTRNSSGLRMPAKCMKSRRSFWYARRVWRFVMFANQTSANKRAKFQVGH